ncbi:glutamate receptor ionotropic, kainate 1-like [Gigantopelta aegis]|uniref:glutamate receptor ionotropic, kainate 1-like n=1 Tax=Gigantopelta aegis TaxID=1735272 RepID=UPI001B88AE16|nr:glutamate receptor ionotropic, kainate 1-like [Gigantopelta aegis]
MSPIEHLWDYLDRQIRQRQQPPLNRQQLQQSLVEKWRRIPNDVTQLKTSLHRLSAFDMRSLWLVAVDNTETELASAWASTLQNVAFVVSSSTTTTRLTGFRPISTDIRNNIPKYICDEKKSGSVVTIPEKPNVLMRTLFPLTPYGMNNKTLVVATLPFHTFVIRSTKEEKTTYSGLCISILDIIAQSLNFSYIIGEPKDGSWGKELKNGTYTGMVAEILKEEIDLIAAPIIPQVERIHKMDFTIPYSWDRIVVMFKKPPLTSTKWLTLVNPFQLEVYLCIGASLVFVVCLVVFVEWNNPYYSPEARQVCTIWHIIRHFTWYAYGSLIKHGGIHLPDSISGRVIIGFWLLFCTIISAVYSANLIAFLTVNIENLKFHTVEDLLDEDSFKWGSTGNYPFKTLKNVSN